MNKKLLQTEYNSFYKLGLAAGYSEAKAHRSAKKFMAAQAKLREGLTGDKK